MIKMPEEFLMAVKASELFEVTENETAMFNSMYEYLSHEAGTKEEWLRRGQVVISFLEDLVGGSYTDGELVHMWISSGAEFHVFSPDIRILFDLMLEKMKEYQAQNEADAFMLLDFQGNPKKVWRLPG